MPEKYILNQRWYSGNIFDNIFKQHLYIQLVAIYLIVTNLRIQEKWKKLEHLIYKNHNKQSQVIVQPFVKNNPLMVEPKSIQRIKDIFVGLAITFAR